jgi:pilus assembly protein CpaB
VTARARRRRAFLFLSLALACGGLAASEVSSRVREVEASVGGLVPVLTAARDVPAGEELRRADLAVREVPERFAPPDALVGAREATGLPVATPLVKGSYVTAAVFGPAAGGEAGARGPAPLRRGERAVEVSVAGGDVLAGSAPGARVDVLISTDAREGPGRTLLALEDVELLDLRAGAGAGAGVAGIEAEGAGATASGTATLRVTLRQAVYLTAAQNFAREVRLLPRPPGDRRRAGRAEVPADGL